MKPLRLYVDFETSSEVDLKLCGASVYARHPSTEILCAAVKVENNPTPYVFFKVKDFVRFVGGWGPHVILVAHNVVFERMIWKHIIKARLGYDELPLSQWICTMAKCLNHSLPRALEQAADALDLLQKKDSEGYRLMLKMSKPDGPRDFESFIKLGRYCFQDCVVSEQIDKRLTDLEPFERRVWEMDQEINERGVKLDRKNILQIMDVLKYEKDRLLAEFQHITENEVQSPTQRDRFKEWVEAKLGAPIKDMRKNTVLRLMETDTPKQVKKALRIRQALAKSSTAKFVAMINSMDADQRIRLSLIYHAAHTSRWGGSNAQLQNLARPKIDVPLALSCMLKDPKILWPLFFGDSFNVASSLLRSQIIPEPGKKLVWVDFAGIEARVTAWFADQQETLELFRNNEDVYCHMASIIFGRKVTKKDKEARNVGKVAVLAMGFNGGINAFYNGCQTYNVSLKPVAQMIVSGATEDELSTAEFCYAMYKKDKEKADELHFNKIEGMAADIIKQRWRAANPKIQKFWKTIEETAIESVQKPNQRVMVCEGVYWRYDSKSDFLHLELPAGHSVKYFKPRVKHKADRFGKEKYILSYATQDSTTKQFIRVDTYGGKLTENLVQAVSRDIMVEAMFVFRDEGLPMVLTVHDELLLELNLFVPLKEVEEKMVKGRDWMTGLPLAAEAGEGLRYKVGGLT